MERIIAVIALLTIASALWGCRKINKSADEETAATSQEPSETAAEKSAPDTSNLNDTIGSDTAGVGTEVIPSGTTMEETDIDTETALHIDVDTGGATETSGDTELPPKSDVASDTEEKYSTETFLDTESDSSKDSETEIEIGCVVLEFEDPIPEETYSVTMETYTDEGTSITIVSEMEGPNNDLELFDFSYFNYRCLDSQKLGTSPMRVSFPERLEPPVSIAAEVDTYRGVWATLTLFDQDGRQVGFTEKLAQPELWPECEPDTLLPTIVDLVAHSDEVVASAVFDYSPHPENHVFAVRIDHLAIRSDNLNGKETCPWNSMGIIPDDVERCDVTWSEDQKSLYDCVDKPDAIADCSECDLDCVRQIIRDMPLGPDECVPYPDELVCGPNPNSNRCCYVYYYTGEWCSDLD